MHRQFPFVTNQAHVLTLFKRPKGCKERNLNHCNIFLKEVFNANPVHHSLYRIFYSLLRDLCQTLQSQSKVGTDMSLDSLNHVFQWDDKLTSVISEHRAYYFLMVNKLFE